MSDEKIKVLMITHNYPRFEGDYAGIFLSLLFKRLNQFDVEPVVLAPHDKGCKEFEEIDGVKIYRFRYAADENLQTIAYRGNMHQLVLGSVSGIFKFNNFLNHFRKAAFEIIKKEKIDIIAGHWLIPSAMVIKPLQKKTNLPAIMSSHGTDIRLMKKYFGVVYKYLKKFCLNLKNWTMVSSYLRQSIVSMDKNLSPILTVLPMPHDETIFYRDESVIRDKYLVVSVTRFTDQKRVNYLISAFAKVVEQNPEAKLHLYGKGPLKNDLVELTQKLGLDKNITFFEPVTQTELRQIYNSAAIVVLNSFEEGFGLALSEAMLCGAAVIGTRSGGITDIIEHDKTGLLVELDRSDLLADAIQTLLNDDNKRNTLAQAGHLDATKKYLSDKLAEKYADIIKQALV